MEKKIKKFLFFLTLITTLIYLMLTKLTSSDVVSHKDITGADLHIPKTHQSSHQKGVTDALSGIIQIDGLELDEDETISWTPAATPAETLTWDSVIHDFRLSDDLYLEDTHPGLVFSNINDRVAYAIHFHYGTNYPFAIWYGTINSDGGFVGGGFPLMYADKTYVYFPRGVGGSIKTPNMKTGTTQEAAKAIAGELWADSDDGYTIKLGQ